MKKKLLLLYGRSMPFSRKKLLILKLTLLLVILNVVNSFASIYAQKISLNLTNVKFSEVLDEISKQTNYDFAYSKNFVDMDRTVSISVSNTELKSVLDQLLDGTGLIHIELNDKIYLGPKNLDSTIAASFTGTRQQRVTGKVIDATSKQPLPGVSILVEGSTKGTITDVDGKYTLEIPGTGAVIVFSYLGYISERITVSGQEVIDVELVPEIKTLDELIVIGYTSQKKADLTGSVAYVKGDDLVKVAGANASTAFAGRMPGVMVTQASGQPGASASIKIRGIGSLNSNTDPLVLIDGMPANYTYTTRKKDDEPTTSPLDFIAPSDIESISVLKDASSASIYGARAANGVILITTKKGRKDQPLRISLTAKTGIQQATHLPKLLNTQEWIEKSNETRIGAGLIPNWVTGDKNTDPALQTTYFDWMDYVFRTAPERDYNITATGGSSKFIYAFNAGYFDQDGIIRGENYKRMNFRSNLEYMGDYFNFGANIAQFRTWTNTTISRGNAMLNIFRTPPTIVAYNPDGTLSDARDPKVYPGEFTENNTPAMDAAALDGKGRNSITTINVYGEVKIFKGLRFKTVLNLRSMDGYSETFTNLWQAYRPDGTLGRANGNARFSNTYSPSTFLWESQNLLTYTLDLKDHHFDVLLGVSAQKEKTNNFNATRNGYTKNNLHSLNAGGGLESANGSEDENSLASQFGRLSYSYKSKYLFQANIRRDGSSIFASGHRWGVFPSFSAGWRISEEDFLKGISVLNNLKLRAGYGTLGNQNIPRFKWLGLMEYQKYVFNNTVVSTAEQTGLYTPGITWEKTTTLNLGLDMTLWNKLDITAEIFNRKTSDMLLEYPVPETSGGGANPYYNVGKVDNKGWEFTVGYNDRIRNLDYGVSFNISHVKNNVVELSRNISYVPGFSPAIRSVVGQPLNSYYGYEVDGIWQKQSDTTGIKVLAGGSAPGDFRYKDLDKNDTIDSRDRTFIGNSFPKFYYGGNIYLKWKGIDFSMLLQGVFDREIYVTPDYGMDLGRYDNANIYKEFYDDTWRKEGDNKYPRLGHNTKNNDINSTWVQDASYLRVKSIEIGYTLPKKYTSKARIEQFRIFATATNPFTFTKYVGFDPEMDKLVTYGGADYPQAKTFLLGVNIIF